MAVFFLLGKYSQESLKGITARRTEQAVGMIEKFNGQVTAMYAMLGPYDLVLIVNLPGIREAMEASVAISKMTGIGFTTCPAISVDRFDEMIEVDLKKYVPNGKVPPA